MEVPCSPSFSLKPRWAVAKVWSLCLSFRCITAKISVIPKFRNLKITNCEPYHKKTCLCKHKYSIDKVQYRHPSSQISPTAILSGWRVHNDPMFSDRQIRANSEDPDQTAPRGAVWSGSSLFAIAVTSFG